MAKTEHIPLHKLKDRSEIGFEIKHSDRYNFKDQGRNLGAHRDDYYIFIITESGSAAMQVDFSEVTLSAASVFYILPGQIHHGIRIDRASGWFVAIDASLVPKEVRNLLENRLTLQQPYEFEEYKLQQYQSLLRLLHTHFESDFKNTYDKPQLFSLLNAFLYSTASLFSMPDTGVSKQLRVNEIAQQFRRLLSANMVQIKQPSAYAEMMNITANYLNEALRKTTGFSVTYWILNEVLLEAKRLLYHTELNVKEIAHQLGYEDHTYFSRIFKKAVAMTPVQFRQVYRK